MSNIPENLKYTKDHEWIKINGDGTATIGITDYAQNSLGDVTFVELPEVGDSFSRGESFGVVESVKAASDLYMPIAGEIIETNEELDNNPEKVNQEPYGEAWIIKVKIERDSDLDQLMSSSDYAEIAE